MTPRRTRGPCDRREPADRMIGIYLGLGRQPLQAVEGARLHDDLSRCRRNLRQDRRPAAVAEVSIDGLPTVTLVDEKLGLTLLLIVSFFDDDIEGEHASAQFLAVRAMAYRNGPWFAFQR